MSKMLITRPNHDDTTSYLFKWSEALIDFAEKKGISCTDFRGPKAERVEVEKFLKKSSPSFTLFNGHGTDDAIYGHKNDILIKSGENDHLLKSKIVYSLSCSSAKVLGESSVEKGARCFIGYDDVFIFAFDKNCSAGRERDDRIAKPFFDSSNQLVLSLLSGRNCAEAYEKSQSTFSNWIERLSSSEAPPGSETVVSWLIWDMYCQKIKGDGNSVL